MPTERPNERLLNSEKTALSIEDLFSAIRAQGFPLVGAVDLDLAEEAFSSHRERYREWIGRGFHGEMGYLERGMERRMDPRLVFPRTQSIVTVAIPYRRNSVSTLYARYLHGPDYHRHIPALLEKALSDWDPGKNAEWKICVDTSAVLERSWAALCGLGWIGKNTLLIHPKFGSYLFLGVILLDQKTGRSPAPLPSYCGHCSRCLDSCPTKAFIEERKLDSKKCISYLTLEKRGEWAADVKPLAPKMGSWIAGCDICQEVCPYNVKPSREAETWPSDERDSALIEDWQALESETETAYQERIRHSALSRIRFPEMKRNLERARTQSS